MNTTLEQATFRVFRDLRGQDVDIPADWLKQVDAVLRPLTLRDLSASEPKSFIEAHFKLLAASFDDVTTIVVSQAIADEFKKHARSMKPEFDRIRKSGFKTQVVLGQKLASRYFHEGRRRVEMEATRASGVYLLQRCRDISLNIAGRDDRATLAENSMLHSQIATATAHVARSMARDDARLLPLLLEGRHHSRLAEEFGDHSADHDGYAVEMALRVQEVTNQDAISDIEATTHRLSRVETMTAQGLTGDVAYANAAAALRADQTETALKHLVAAIEHFDRAIALPAVERSADIGYLHAKRGRCHTLLYERAPDGDGRRDTHHLDLALNDWLDPHSSPHRNDHEVARMLLARARQSMAREAVPDASADLDLAAHLLQGSGRKHLDQQLDGQVEGVRIERALDESDSEAVSEALASATQLQVGTPAPCGPMSKAVAWLHNRIGSDRWFELAEQALDRIELDGLHPALSAPARGHAAGHAASLARLLYIGGAAGGVSDLGLSRALDLSRAHVDAAIDLSASALDGASSAAFVNAVARIRTAEGASEDELGLWTDALLWGLSALETQQRVRTTVAARFDVSACAERVTTSAAVLADLSNDSSFLDLAEAGTSKATTLIGAAATQMATTRLVEARARVQATGQDSPVTLTSQTEHRTTANPRSRAKAALESVGRLTPSDPANVQRPEDRVARQQAAEALYALAETSGVIIGGKERGGQRGVRSMRDPFGIGRQLVILKRVDTATAMREYEALEHLIFWLAASDHVVQWGVPEPLGVVDVGDGDGVLVIRRVPGHTLAHHAFEHLDGRGPSPWARYLSAVDALGEFHTAMHERPAPQPEDQRTALRTAAGHLVSSDAAERTAAMTAEMFQGHPTVATKDAHGGNWLWSATSGGLVALDIEGRTTRPVLVELATLIDDLPLLSLDDEGWESRRSIANRYLERLPRELIPVESSDLLLEASVLRVGLTGLARMSRRNWGASSRGVRFAKHQVRHYSGLIGFLVESASTPEVRRVAKGIKSAAGL